MNKQVYSVLNFIIRYIFILERIHQAHGAAQKAKKSLAQTSKPKSSKAVSCLYLIELN